MTIIKSNKTNHKINFLISFLMLTLVISAVFGVFLYNQLVDFRHEIVSYEKIIKTAEVENAELKNALYQLLDAGLPNSQSFVLDKNPEYIKQQAVAIQY